MNCLDEVSLVDVVNARVSGDSASRDLKGKMCDSYHERVSLNRDSGVRVDQPLPRYVMKPIQFSFAISDNSRVRRKYLLRLALSYLSVVLC